MWKSTGAPAQHKQPSRKGKKAWRKNVDITEVQSGLEALREEIIQGGPISEKPSNELFALDIVGSEDIKSKHKLGKPLKVDEILARRSAVPAVDSRKRGRITDGVIEAPSKRAKNDWISKKEVSRLRQVADRTSHLDSEQIDEHGNGFDLWAETAAPQNKDDESQEYIPRKKAKVAPATIKKAPQPMTASGKPVKAVRNPDAGTSYNPSFEAWDDLLNRTGADEVAAEQSRLAAVQAEADKQARIAASAAEDAGARTDNESEWEGFETEADEIDMLKQKRPKRKSQAERNKINRRKEAERLAKHEKRTSEKQKQVEQAVQNTLSVIEREDGDVQHALVRHNSSVEASESDGDSDSGDDTKLRRRKLGNQPIPTKSLELVLPDELQESLRQLKPEGNLLQDRFRNLLVNGKVESRKPVLYSKKKRVKVTEKWSYKDFGVRV